MELESLIDCAGTAAWRRMKAEEYPEDDRNLKAAVLLDQLAEGVSQLEGSAIHCEVEKILEREAHHAGETLDCPFHEVVSEHLRWVGFSYAPKDAGALLVDIKRALSV